jgi:hypothetical protein
MGKRRMKMGREAKRQAGLVQAASRPPRIAVRSDSKRGQHVGAAALTGDSSVAVLDDARSGPGGHQGGRGANVERPRAVTAGAAGVENIISTGFQGRHVLTQHPRSRSQLRARFTFHAHRNEKGGNLDIVTAPCEDLPQNGADLLIIQISML